MLLILFAGDSLCKWGTYIFCYIAIWRVVIGRSLCSELYGDFLLSYLERFMLLLDLSFIYIKGLTADKKYKRKASKFNQCIINFYRYFIL